MAMVASILRQREYHLIRLSKLFRAWFPLLHFGAFFSLMSTPLSIPKYAYNPPNLWFLTHFWRVITRFCQILFLILHLKIVYIDMIIGRKPEQKELLEAANSEYSKFVAVYGRRRVGKTFLIRETFNYSFTFQHTGLARGKMKDQLLSFRASLQTVSGKKYNQFKNWYEAFLH